MGLIRKTLAVGTLGAVRPSSKKQRVARATLKELRTQTRLMRDQAGELPSILELKVGDLFSVQADERRDIDELAAHLGDLIPKDAQAHIPHALHDIATHLYAAGYRRVQ